MGDVALCRLYWRDELYGREVPVGPRLDRPRLRRLKRRGLLYLADGSTDGSVTGRVATALELEYDVADVHLDNGRMDRQLAKLEAAAKENGTAIGVAKAAPGTVKRIADWAGSLEGKGLVLVPVSAAVRTPRQG